MSEYRRNAFWIIVIGMFAIVLAFRRGKTDDNLVAIWKLESTQTNGHALQRQRELWVIRSGTITIIRADLTQRVNSFPMEHRRKTWRNVEYKSTPNGTIQPGAPPAPPWE